MTFSSKKILLYVGTMLLSSFLLTPSVLAQHGVDEGGGVENPNAPLNSGPNGDQNVNISCCKCRISRGEYCVNVFGIESAEFAFHDCSDLTHTDGFAWVTAHSSAGGDLTGISCDATVMHGEACSPVGDPTAHGNGRCPVAGTQALENIANPSSGPIYNEGAHQFTSITPIMSVPIQGITFTAARQNGNQVTVPFLAQYIAGIYKFAIQVAGILAAIMVVYGGFKYLLGASLPEVKGGKEVIVDAVTGLVVLLAAYLILRTINPALVTLQPLTLDYADRNTSNFQNDGTLGRTGGSSGGGGGGGQLCDNHTTDTMHQTLNRYCNSAGETTAFLAACEGAVDLPSGHSPTASCVALAGAPQQTGLTQCGKEFGVFLSAVTGACRSKDFDGLYRLDGITWGIRDYTYENSKALLELMYHEDSALFRRTFANASLSEWLDANGNVNQSWFNNQQVSAKGLYCNTAFRTALEQALHEPAFIKAQTREAFRRYESMKRIAQSLGFNSARGITMIATMLNNPGGCEMSDLVHACTGHAESEKIDCVLDQFVAPHQSQSGTTFYCRGSQSGAISRRHDIEAAMGAFSANPTAEPSHQTIEDILSCAFPSS